MSQFDRQIEELKIKSKSLAKQISDNDKEISRLKVAKEQALRKPVVSDHAVLRYLERHLGVDVETIRSGLLTDKVIQAMNIGCTGIKLNGGTLKFSGKTVTTYIE